MVKAPTKHLFATALLLFGGSLAILWPSHWFGGAIILGGLAYGTAVAFIPHTPLRWPITLLALLALLSPTLITADPAATQPAANWFAVSLAGYALFLGWATTSTRQQTAAALLVFMGSGFALLAPFLVTWGRIKISLIPSAVYTIFPTLAADAVHPNTLASALLLLLPLPLAWVLAHFHHRNKMWWLALVAALLIGGVLFLTQSRAGYIASAVSLIFLLWLANWRKTSLGAGTLLLMGSFALIFLTNTAAPADPFTTATDTGSFNFRLQVWSHTLELLHDFPFTGVGMGAFNPVSERLYPFPLLEDKGAHNLYLSIAAEMGILALIAYFAILGNVGWMAWRVIQKIGTRPSLAPLAHGLTTGLLALHLHGLFDNTLWPTRLAFLPWLFIALLAALHQTPTSPEHV